MTTTIILLLIMVVLAVFSGIWFKSSSNDVFLSDEDKIQEKMKAEGEKTREAQKTENPLDIPLENALERATKKPFGIKVSPNNSPVQPERFSGYHTGADFEVTEKEKGEPIKVRAVCHGEIIENKIVGGYGGTIVQKCALGDGEEDIKNITVIYGHLDIAKDLTLVKPGQFVGEGDVIGFLAPPKTRSSGFERKHLHLGIIKGSEIDYRGYVQDQKELNNWMNPLDLLEAIR